MASEDNTVELKEEVPDIVPFDPTKKKKKRKVVIQDPIDEPVDNLTEKTESLSVSDGVENSFAGLKKKKKKPVENNLSGDDTAEGGKEKDDLLGDEEGEGIVLQAERPRYPWEGSDRDYTYEELLGRGFNILRENNPELAGDRRRTVMRPPQVLREGTKKTVFVNLMDLCKTCDEHDDVQAKLDATRSLRDPDFVEKLKRMCRDRVRDRSNLASKPELSLEASVKNQIQLALDYYKDEMKGGDYEFVKCEKMLPPSLLVAHTNFYARLKGTDFSPELFFAVLENGKPQKCTHCCKLDTRFYSVDGTMIHCEHVKCTACAKWRYIPVGPKNSVII